MLTFMIGNFMSTYCVSHKVVRYFHLSSHLHRCNLSYWFKDDEPEI
jgi:hypothetical protein